MEKEKEVIYVKTEKSVGIAIILTVLLGPLGVFYSSVLGGVVLSLLTLIIGVATLGYGLFIMWPVCIIVGAVAAGKEE
jgi:hypothetical protein